MIDLRCEDVTTMLGSLPDGCAALIHADPPWAYGAGKKGHGKAQAHYDGLTEPVIAQHLAAAYRVARADCYLVVWCTFPKLWDWARHDGLMRKAGWEYISGGSWGKRDKRRGIGYHFLGDAELVLVYMKGNPSPVVQSSNLWLTDEDNGALWLAARGTHSEKPQNALRSLVTMATEPDALVVDLYAGDSGSLARACQFTGRRYIGAELDPARHARALVRLSQQEMAWEGVA